MWRAVSLLGNPERGHPQQPGACIPVTGEASDPSLQTVSAEGHLGERGSAGRLNTPDFLLQTHSLDEAK